jgi:hypothetical protein
MKKIAVLLVLNLCVIVAANSQVTNYGVGSGTQGNNNAFFGDGAGSATITPRNTALGSQALHMNYGGYSNTATGHESLFANTTGSHNTANGQRALKANTIGDSNTAVGYATLTSNITAGGNTAVGAYALNQNTSGQQNAALGLGALELNNGNHNVAIGTLALYSSTTASHNTAAGAESLFKNTTGHHNTAQGYRALYKNITGYYNSALGSEAMYSNNDGKFNIAMGYYAMYENVSGNHNSATGFRALNNSTTGGNNTAHGSFALDNITTGSYNSAVGFNAGPAVGDLSNTTAIGYQAVPTASNQVRIGNVSVTSIGGQVSWSTFSDGRFKRDIKEDVSGLDFINQLRPVSYVIDKKQVEKFLIIPDSVNSYDETRINQTRQTGFIAQEVEAMVKKAGYVFYGVDAPENENDHYSVRYAEFVVPLIKAVQELTAEIRDQRQKILEQEQKIESLTIQMKRKNADGSITPASSQAVLLQNNPNPFAADTEIKMMLPDQIQYAVMIIYNPEGKQLKTIPINDRGDVTIKIAGNEFSAGMYFYILITDGDVVDIKRMILTH